MSRGDAGVAGEPGDIGRGVAQCCHELGSGAKPDPGGVLTLGDVTDVVDAVLDGPVPVQPFGEQPGVGGSVVQGGDAYTICTDGLLLPTRRRRTP